MSRTLKTNAKAATKEKEEAPKAPSKDVVVLDEKARMMQAFQDVDLQSEDNFDQSDVVVPRIKLLQGTSPEVEAFEKAKPGIFWHTGFDEPLGNEFVFIPCSRRKKYLLVAPMEDGQGVLARADDAKTWDKIGKWAVKFKDQPATVEWQIKTHDVEASGLTRFGTSVPHDPDSPPAATLFYEYLVLLPDFLDFGPAVLSLARSQVARAKRGLNDKIDLHARMRRPMQSLKFKATVTNEQNKSSQGFKNLRFQSDGFLNVDDELFKQARDLYTVLRNFKVNEDAHEGDTGRTGGETAAPTVQEAAMQAKF